MKGPPRANAFRDSWAGTLNRADAGREVRVAGWVDRRRDHGGLIFVDLRDRSGLLQLVFHPESAAEAHAAAHDLRGEHVISVRGTILERDPTTVNTRMATGEIELSVAELAPLAESETPPFPLDEDVTVDEGLRLRYRALDLRRAPMQHALALRHTVTATMREVLDARDFLEVETPMLTRSTPEGARDYLVPARIAPGSFYALPQSPQLFKQLLMIGGIERYYQIVRCFRDEDARADRQPEFTQLDLELSFVDEEDVLETMEAVMSAVFERAGFAVAPAPWPRLGYDDCMMRYGSDRPDTRFGLEIADLGDALAATEFKVFAGALAGGGVVRGLNAGAREIPRKELDALTELAKRHGANGLVWAFVQEDGSWRSPIAKFLTDSEVAALTARLDGSPGDLLLAVADRAAVAAAALGALRLELRDRFALVRDGAHHISWVVDFPMFAWSVGEQRWDALHHPFTAPLGDLADPGSLRSRAYDLVLDGAEIGGGSIRISSPAVQRAVLEIIGIGEEEADRRFGFLLEHLRFGAPPHGGIAMGVDRIVAALAGHDAIREVIAFPKAASGADPLTGAPAPVEEAQLRELGLALDPAGRRRP